MRLKNEFLFTVKEEINKFFFFCLQGTVSVELYIWHEMPEIKPAFEDEKLKNIFQYFSTDPEEMGKELQLYAGELLNLGKLAF